MNQLTLTILSRRIIFSFIWLLIIFGFKNLVAQNAPQHTWSNQIYIPNQPNGILGSTVTPLASKTDAQGNTYLFGSFRGTVDLNPGDGIVTATSTNSGGVPATTYQATYLVKLDKYGQYVWSHAFSSAAGGQNWAKGIDITPQGKIFVTGFFNGTLYVSNATLDGLIGGRASYCAYMVFFNEDGTVHNYNKLQGAVVYSGLSGTFLYTNIDIHSSKIDEDGNIIVAGAVGGDTGGNGIDLDLKTATVVSYSKGDYFIAKYDTAFNLLANKKLTFANGNTLRVDQIEAKNDTVFVQGFSDQATANFNGTANPALVPINNGNYFTAAYTSNNLDGIWAFKQAVEKQVIKINPTGGLAYAWQATAYTFDIDPTANTVLVNGGQYNNIFIAHFNTNTGALITSGTKTARRISDTLINTSLYLGDFDFAANGSFFINGIFGSGVNNIDMDPGPGVVNITSNGNNGSDCYLAKYNANFSLGFAQALVNPGTGSESMIDIEALDTNTFVITTSSLTTGLHMDPSKLAPTISPGAFYGGIYAKYTSGANNILVSLNSADTVESCKLLTTINATSTNNNYTYQWYKNGGLLTTETNATINTTDVGTYQCLVKNANHQQWSKKIMFTLLGNMTTYFSYQLNGDANNEMSANQHGVSNSITYGKDRFGINNNAAVFNGTSSEIVVNGALISATYTGASLWFKRANSTRKAMSLLAFQVAAPGTWNPILYLDSTGRLSGYVWPGNGFPIYSSAVVVDTNWHHAAWTYDATKGKQIIYLDGVEVGSRTSGTLQPAAANLFKIGNGFLNTTLANVPTTGNNQYFEGSIDQVKVTSTLRAGNVLQLFNEIKILSKTPEVAANGIASVCANYPVTTTINAANPNLTYKWYYNYSVVSSNDTNFTGVGTNSFTIKNMPSGDLPKNYHYVNINDNFCNSILYEGVPLTGVTTSTITTQPSNQTACIGGSTFFVTKANAVKSYTWKRNGNVIPNSNNDTLYLTNITNADLGNYTCTITSCNDTLVTTNSANLSLIQTAISQQPVSQTTCSGSIVTLTVATNTPNATYLWKKNGIVIPDSNNDSLVFNPITNSNFGAYTVEIGGCSSPLRSDTAFLTQGPSIAINNNQLRLHLKLNGSVTDATGTNATTAIGTITYALDKNNVTSGAADFNATSYISVTHSTNMVFSNTISIAFWLKPKTYNDCRFIDKSAGNANNFFIDQTGGSLRAYVAGKAVIINELPPLNSWTHITVTYLSTGVLAVYYNGVLKGSTSGANAQLTSNGNNLFVGAVQGATCKVNALMDDVRIYGRELAASEIPGLMNSTDITFTSLAQSICEGGTFTTQVTTSSDASYQWFRNGVLINGATASTYTKTNALVSDSGTYTCEVYTGGCVKQTATVGKITINPKATITVEPSNASACANGTVQLSVTAIGLNNTYSWYKNGTPLSNGGNISGANSSTLNISFFSSNEVAAYHCIVSNTCGTDTSAIANVSLNSGLQITQQPTNVVACAGTNALLIVKSNDQSATYSWRKNGSAIANSNNDTLTLTNVNSTNVGTYQVVISSNCGSDSSAQVSLTVNANTLILNQPTSKISCGGIGFILSADAIGTNIAYQWRLNGNDLANQTSSVLVRNTTTAADTGNYTVVVTGSCGVVTSSVAKVSLAYPISITTQPDSVLKACGSDVNITSRVTATGTINGYQWFLNNVAINDNLQVTGATTNQIRFEGGMINEGNLTCKIYGTCDTVTTRTVVFSYYQNPVFVSSPTAQSTCIGGSATFKAKATNVSGYKWYLNNTLISDIPNKISGTGTDSVTFINLTTADIGGTSATIYAEAIGYCPSKSIITGTADLTLNSNTSITNQTASAVSACESSSLLLYVNTNNNASYIWKKNGVIVPNQTNDTLLITNATANDAGTYTCDVSSPCGNITSNNIVVSINTAPTPTITQSGNTLSTQSFTTYQWYKETTLLAGANAQTYTATESGNYRVMVTNSNGCSATSTAYNFTFVGLNDIQNLSKQFSAYPNPANQLITIKVTSPVSDEWTVKVYDIAGAEITTTNLFTQTSVNIETWAKGMYIIKATNTKGQTAVLRFIKD